MRSGLYLPNFGAFGDARLLAEIAREAERAGWEGVFLWDHIARAGGPPLVDPWIALTAMALASERLRLGALVTPLSRRRPWQLARAAASLDRLSNGRLVFGAGLGSGRREEWQDLGEESDPRLRAERLDEALDVIAGLWSGEAFSYSGRHFSVSDARFAPAPLQRPRVPVWIGGYWPNRAPFRRAARWDGAFPLFREEGAASLPALAECVRFLRQQRRGGGPFDVVHLSPPTRERDAHEGAREAGATWWLERMTPDAFGADWSGDWPLGPMREHVRRGPPASR